MPPEAPSDAVTSLSPEILEPYRLTPVCRWLIGSTVAVFLLQFAVFQYRGFDFVGQALAFSPQAWNEHRYWTLLTYAWAHAVRLPGAPGFFWIHITLDLLPLFLIGPILEEYLGPWRFLLLYLGGAVAAALVWIHFYPQAASGMVGASGAMFAVIAAAGTMKSQAEVTDYLFFVIPVRRALTYFALALCGGEVVQIVFHWLPQVAHAAHLGGAAFGFLFVMACRIWAYFRGK